jgi:hypothetical protein
MLHKLPFSVSTELLGNAVLNIFDTQPITINQPTGNFFYDDWQLKSEYKGTAIEQIYSSLPERKGEARIISLSGGEAYSSHADIDDRYHLNLSGDRSFLIDLDTQIMHETKTNGHWYLMDAGRRHSAVNFGYKIRYQLVIRKLLDKGNIEEPINVKITVKDGINLDTARFIFDDVISSWLNNLNKEKMLDNFSYSSNVITFTTNAQYVYKLEDLLPKEFNMEIV